MKSEWIALMNKIYMIEVRQTEFGGNSLNWAHCTHHFSSYCLHLPPYSSLLITILFLVAFALWLPVLLLPDSKSSQNPFAKPSCCLQGLSQVWIHCGIWPVWWWQSLSKETREIDEHLEGYISFMADYGFHTTVAYTPACSSSSCSSCAAVPHIICIIYKGNMNNFDYNLLEYS